MLPEPSSSSPTLAAYATAWCRTTAPRVKPATAAVYAWALAWLTRVPIGAVPLAALRRPDIRGLVADLFLAGLEQHSVTRVVALVRVVLNAAVEDDLLAGNVALRPGTLLRQTRRGPVRVPVSLSATTVDQLIAHADRAAFAVLLLCLARTGLRIGEALALRWSDYDAQARTLTVRRLFGRYGLGTPKSGRRRVVGVSPQLAHALAGLRGAGTEDGWIFPSSRRDLPWSQSTIRRMVKAIAARIGMPLDIHPHALRHTFATAFAAVTTDLRDVQRALGHATLAQTEHYIHEMTGTDPGLFAKLDRQADET